MDGAAAAEFSEFAHSRTQSGQPGPGFLASPIVVGGVVYIGADTGWFYN